VLELQGLEAVAERYKNKKPDNFSALLLGESGTGKTLMLKSLPGSTLIHSFDPTGAVTLRKYVDKQEMLIDDKWEDSNIRKPLANEWYKAFQMLIRNKVFDNIDNYVIDSYTFFSQMYIDQIKNDNNRSKFQLQDWGELGGLIKDVLKECCALKCRFILTAHIVPIEETLPDKSKRIVGHTILANPKLQLHIPALFSEIYCLTTKTVGKEIVREILTDRWRNYIAKTRLGEGGVFDLFEKPDFTYLLNKLKSKGALKE